MSVFMLFFMSKIVVSLLLVLLSVAFVTLLERKFLSLSQLRKGPEKTSFKGLFQPFSDALKLFSKEFFVPSKSHSFTFLLSPAVGLFLVFMLWFSNPSFFSMAEVDLSLIFIMSCLGASVYYIFAAGWFSMCKYAMLGSMRGIAQTISYEVSFFLILLSFTMLVGGFNFSGLDNFSGVWLSCLSPVLMGVWFVSCLGETNRTPFDFSESESELVSGFNSEFSAGPFSLFFLSEYGFILFLSFIFSVLFLGGFADGVFVLVKTVLVTFLFVWVRASLPRLRYDKFMDLAWKIFLPLSLSYLVFFSGLVFFLI